MAELKYWVWLSSLSAVRPRVKNELLKKYQDPREAYYAPRGAFESLEDIKPAELVLLEERDMSPVGEIIDICAEKNIKILTMHDIAYPQRLANIYDPPIVLYVRGSLPDIDDEAAVAIVGTRKATPYGIKMANRLGYEITKYGGLVISGLTAGVDSAAARGALLAGGGCVGVLATPIDGDFAGSLARDVAAAGALISEYPPGTETSSGFFRARNRITSGLAVATVVVEAPARSGALLFASEATDQGKEVYVVPANADAVNSAGSNKLLKDGAAPVTNGWDVLGDFENRFRDKLYPPDGRRISMPRAQEPAPAPAAPADFPEDFPDDGGFAKFREPIRKKVIDKENSGEYIDLKKQLEGLSEIQLQIVSAIDKPSVHVDDIIERAGIPAARVLAELTMLQIKGIVTQESGKRFTLNIKQK